MYHYNDTYHSLGISFGNVGRGLFYDTLLYDTFKIFDLERPFGSRKTWRRTSLAGATRPLMESDLLNGFGLLLAQGLPPN